MIQGLPGKTEEAARIFQESVIPAAKQQKGFKGAYFLTDPATGKGMSLTLWETEQDMKAGESSDYLQQQIAKFGPLLAGPPERSAYLVAAQA